MEKPLAFIIEDDEDLNTIFSTALKAAGYMVEAFQDGQNALDKLEELIPSIVILDLHLPHISGDQILKRIRENDRLDQTKVILTTADHQMAATLESQVDLVLIKPISYKQLRELAVRLFPDNSEQE